MICLHGCQEGPVGTAILDQIAEGGTFIAYGDLSGAPLEANAFLITIRRTKLRCLVATDRPAFPEDARRDVIRLAEKSLICSRSPKRFRSTGSQTPRGWSQPRRDGDPLRPKLRCVPGCEGH